MRIVMMGTGDFAEPTFQALLASPHPVVGLVTNPDRPSGREREMLRGMKQIALDHQVPVFQPESVNTPEGVAGVRAFQPDLLVVAAYGQILSRDVLAVAPHGGINVHASLLPKYRGAAPIAWAIYHGETETGVTIIKMSVHLDAGDMLAQEAVAIGPEETAGELEDRLAPMGARLALRVIDQIAAGTATGRKQDKAQVTKAPKLTKEHGLIDWTRLAPDVCNQVRAMQPWPTAYTYWHRQGQEPLRLIVWKTCPGVGSLPALAPGTIDPAPAGQGVLRVVAAAGSTVEVVELQPAGKRRMAAAEFLRGHHLQSGGHFGPAVP
jgi:methionyl-tRNA formyltransferase